MVVSFWLFWYTIISTIAFIISRQNKVKGKLNVFDICVCFRSTQTLVCVLVFNSIQPVKSFHLFILIFQWQKLSSKYNMMKTWHLLSTSFNRTILTILYYYLLNSFSQFLKFPHLHFAWLYWPVQTLNNAYRYELVCWVYIHIGTRRSLHQSRQYSTGRFLPNIIWPSLSFTGNHHNYIHSPNAVMLSNLCPDNTCCL